MVGEERDPSDKLSETGLQNDRRRAGRIKYTNPWLIALLRQRTPSRAAEVSPEDPAEDRRDDLAAAKGIALAVLVGILWWIAIAFAFRFVFKAVPTL